jgi:hypothetical protein
MFEWSIVKGMRALILEGHFDDLGEIVEMKSWDTEDRYILVQCMCLAVWNLDIDRDFLPTVFGWRISQIIAL